MMRIAGLLMALLLAATACKNPFGSKKLFSTLDSTQTGIGFVNKLTPTEKLNLLDYLYFYNGGGVSAGDVNGDGLNDLYFVSNQGKNRLYLNKGKLRFEDVTDKAGVAGFADWQTGTTMADINGDGRLDLYVCAVGNFRGLEGANELYINTGNDADGVPIFQEKAADYGLDFTGFSTQAAFFDYDHDGDLDMYLLNHAVHTSRSYDRVTARHLRQNESGDYLFKNLMSEREKEKGGKGEGNIHSITGTPAAQSPNHSVKTPTPVRFENVSEKAGIYGAAMGYGLGLAVADLNNDGWEDLYVSNDFHEDDYYYLNNRNGTFTESIKTAFGHTSRFSMGNDVADVNNDGFADVVTLDMYPADETVEKSSLGEDPLDIYQYKLSFGYMNQYSRNCLQINQSGKRFMDIGAMAGVAATDWSWSPLLADYDNDGRTDLFVSNGIVHRPNNLDYVKFASDDSLRYAMETSTSLDERAIKLMPDGKVHNYFFRGKDGWGFEDKSLDWGFETPTYSNGAAYADLDNDGDLDLITNNIDEAAGIYRNDADALFPNHHHLTVRLNGDGGNRFGIGAKVILKYADSLQVQQLMPTRGFESSSALTLLFGLGGHTSVDSLVVIWPNQQMQVLAKVKTNQTLTLNQADARQNANTYRYTSPAPAPLFTDISHTDSIPYRHKENRQYYDFVRESLMPFQVSTEGPHLATGDVNGDGRPDLYVGGAKWQPGQLLLQNPNGRFVPSAQPAFVTDSTFEDVDAVFLDADGDKDLDLYVVSGGNEFFDKMPEQFDRLYVNDGKGNFSRDEKALPPMYTNKSCVRPQDIDGDGDLDLFVGGRVVGYAYGQTPDSYLLINDGHGHFSDQTGRLAPALRNAGMLTDGVWFDFDGDRQTDLLVVGDWMKPRLFLNKKGHFTEKTDLFDTDTRISGLWQRVVAADFDRDGDTDLMAANLGTNTKLMHDADPKLRMWVKDVDNNQSIEQILAYNRGNTWYPLAFKDELGKQMPGIINKRFVEYKRFAGKPLTDIFTSDDLKGAEPLEVNQFASVYLENVNGRLVVHPLPPLAQVSKLFALLPIDIDHDGDLDVLGGGNFYGVSTYQGRYDASLGLVLRNDGKGQFTALSPVDSGFLLNGEIRDIRPVTTTQGLLLLAARNNAGIQVFRPIR